MESFLTGFKFIGDRIGFYEDLGYGPHFEFGYEESYGCLIDPFVRDKDAIQAILLYCEMAVWYYHRGLTLGEAYKALGEKYGYHLSKMDSIFYRGFKGAEEIKKIMDKLRKNPPEKIMDIAVSRVEDYELSLAKNSDGTTQDLLLPKSNVIRIILEDGSWVAVRPSGTEPKCKIYVEAISPQESDINDKCSLLFNNVLDILAVAN